MRTCRLRAALCSLLALACMLSAGGASAARDLSRPELMPPHPSLLAQLKAAGYDSATVVSLAALARQKAARGIDQPAPISAPPIGAKPALVLLVDFSDNVHNAVSTPASYEDLLFSLGTYPAPGSMRDFYQKNSYGQFDISPYAVDTAWRRAPHTYAYYTNGDSGFGNYPMNAQGLVRDTVLAADPDINFASFAVAGKVAGLFVVHAGIGAEATGSPNDIWSHMWVLGPYAPTVDGVKADEYSMEPEFTWSAGDSTVGVFAHEYGHVLGLPDLYDTDYTSEGLGNWSVMAGGSWNGVSKDGDSPAYLDPYCRSLLGWAKVVTPVTFVLGALIPAAETNSTIYRLWTGGGSGTQYFLLENRRRVAGDFDYALPGSGLLLYHVDETADQTVDWHPTVMIEQADGLWDLQYAINGGDGGDSYPGLTNKRTVTNTTTPNTKSYANTDTLVRIANISDSRAIMSANLTVSNATWLEDDDPAIIYLGVWPTATDPAVTGGHLRYAAQAGARAILRFKGTGIKWHTVRASNLGKANFRVDGVLVAAVDLFGLRSRLVVYAKAGLASGTHTVIIEVTGKKNAYSSAAAVPVDAFEVIP